MTFTFKKFSFLGYSVFVDYNRICGVTIAVQNVQTTRDNAHVTEIRNSLLYNTYTTKNSHHMLTIRTCFLNIFPSNMVDPHIHLRKV